MGSNTRGGADDGEPDTGACGVRRPVLTPQKRVQLLDGATRINNNWAVDRNYRLGMVQIYNLNIQKTIAARHRG